mmetsp:Transcript_124801/g.285939  ORF Transcript_124801/g.285939 Transcript_124801/m.285939 type:complete len:288 (+) Transcript_124801:871-1734(+)
MCWCLERADAAPFIVETICGGAATLQIASVADAEKLVARLYLVSDLLFNSCSQKQGAWSFRTEFEKRLPELLEFCGAVARSMDATISSRLMERSKHVVYAWTVLSIFSRNYLRGLEVCLSKPVTSWRGLQLPGWLQPKVAEWSHQHFSQLEKLCRSLGLRSDSSSANGDSAKAPSESTRIDFLLDRLVGLELDVHDHKQRSMGREAPVVPAAMPVHCDEDLDGESFDSEDDRAAERWGYSLDGDPVHDGDEDSEDLDGDPVVAQDVLLSKPAQIAAGFACELDGEPV